MMLTAEQLDLFKELLNLGIGKSAALLNQMTNFHFTLKSLEIRVEDLQKIKIELLTAKKEDLTSVKLGFNGELSGIAELVFPSQSASKLATLLTGEGDDSPNFDPIKKSTISEVANILLNSIMGMISNFLAINFQYDIPEYREEKFSEPVIQEGGARPVMLFGEANFSIKDLQIEGYIFIVLEQEAFDELKIILNKLIELHNPKD